MRGLRWTAVVLALVSLSVLGAWTIRIEAFLWGDSVPMQPATATSFLLAAGMLPFVPRGNGFRALVLTTGAVAITVVMGGALVAPGCGFEHLLPIPRESYHPVHLAIISPVTMATFLVFAGHVLLVTRGGRSDGRGVIGYGMTAVGASALLGYLFRVPVLYYDVSFRLSPMAWLTAVCFVTLGLAMAWAPE